MKVAVNIGALHRSKWYEYVLRFAFGGSVTVLAGVIAAHYGPAVGGLFLAFPAIFPATATLLEKHEGEKEQSVARARKVAGIDAAGASMGSVGLIAFAILIWKGLLLYPLSAVLVLATIAWLLVAVTVWWTCRVLKKRLRFAIAG